MSVVPKNIGDYLRQFANQLEEKILQQFPPLHQPGEPMPPELARLRRKPYPAQALAVAAIAKRWDVERSAGAIAECGTGKTLISLGAIFVHAKGRPFTALAMVPPQLVEKMARECFLTLPRVRVFFIDGVRNGVGSNGHAGVNEVKLRSGRIVREGLRTTLSDLRLRKDSRSARSRWASICDYPAVFIVSRERAKLGYFWRHAYGVPRSGPFNGAVVNPDTGRPVLTDDDQMRRADFRKAKHSELVCGDEEFNAGKARRTMFSALWQADGSKVRRCAPMDFIGRHMKGFFDYGIADEVHELKGADTAQGAALGTIASCAKRTIILTGTLNGGYADDGLSRDSAGATNVDSVVWRLTEGGRSPTGVSRQTGWRPPEYRRDVRPFAMPAFVVETAPEDQPAFRVLGPDGQPVAEIQEFLSYLATCGRSGYTLHSYATGLAHFFGWLHESGKRVNDVTRHMVGQYIGAFGRSRKRRPGARQVAKTDLGDQEGRTSPSDQRRPRTINHRLSVLASYFAFCIQRDEDLGSGAWFQRANPVSTTFGNGRHGLTGGDRPARGRAGEFRRRVPREIHRPLPPAAAEQLINAATSYRDKSILTLLFRTGQRIGDWHDIAGRHGVLGMELADIDEQRGTITVRLKWNRDEHRVPVTEDFWPLFRRYLTDERGENVTAPAAWVAMRKGKGKPLTYVAFESSLRYISGKTGIDVHAHMFRHTVAQAVLETTGNLKVAQELLGHAHVTTTADLYMHVDERALVEAVSAVKSTFDGEGNQANGSASADPPARERYAFAYDEITIEELEKAAVRRVSSPGDQR